MKTLIAATPRSGSHAFCSLYPNDYSECMNIEDMLLPRFVDSGAIDIKSCSDIFLEHLNNHNWFKAYDTKPTIKSNHFVIGFDDSLKKKDYKVVVSKQEFCNEHQRRWNILEKQDTWTIKVMKYQGIPKHIIEQMKKQADRIIILKRKDMLQQALSLCKSSMIQLWHNNLGKTLKANAGKLDYNQFAQKVLSIKEEEAWIEQNFTTAERLFYEDLDLSKSGYTKNDIHIDYDAARCEKIIRQLT